MKTCEECNSEEEQLFAPFEVGNADFCSDCQLEIEQQIIEDEGFEALIEW